MGRLGEAMRQERERVNDCDGRERQKKMSKMERREQAGSETTIIYFKEWPLEC